MVDGVSSIASIDFRMDEWGVDLRRHRLAEGPHAAGRPRHRLRQPEGARRCTTRPSCRGCFFDFGDMRKANATGYFPYTPSLPMLYGLRESLAMLLEEGLENVFARHHRLAEGHPRAP